MKTMDPSEIGTHPMFEALFSQDDGVRGAIEGDMRERGFMRGHPIELGVWPGQDDPVVVDGHTRLRVALELGLGEVPVVGFRFASEAAALEYAIHNQRDRRNLSDADLLRLVEAVDRPFPVGGDRSAQTSGSNDPVEGIGSNEPGHTSAAVTAQALGVSEAKVKRARRVLKDPKKREAVEAGSSMASVTTSTKTSIGSNDPGQNIGSNDPVVVVPKELWDGLVVHGQDVPALCVALLTRALEELVARDDRNSNVPDGTFGRVETNEPLGVEEEEPGSNAPVIEKGKGRGPVIHHNALPAPSPVEVVNEEVAGEKSRRRADRVSIIRGELRDLLNV